MEKLDLKKTEKQYYKPSNKVPTIIDIPEFNFIMIDGKGNPNKSDTFSEAINALYSVSYTLKFMMKKSNNGIDYSVMPLEGLWWCDDMSKFSVDKKEDWIWTLMIRQPDFINNEDIKKAVTIAKEKGIKAINNIRIEKLTEGLSVQIMHIGPFTEEGPTIEKMHIYAFEKQYNLRDKHHEIYLSDIRKADLKIGKLFYGNQ